MNEASDYYACIKEAIETGRPLRIPLLTSQSSLFRDHVSGELETKFESVKFVRCNAGRPEFSADIQRQLLQFAGMEEEQTSFRDLTDVFIRTGSVFRDADQIAVVFLEDFHLADQNELYSVMCAVHRAVNQLGHPILVCGVGTPVGTLHAAAQSHPDAEMMFEFFNVASIPDPLAA